MRLEQPWGRPASEEILLALPGAMSGGPPGHADPARSKPLQARRPTRARRAWKAAQPPPRCSPGRVPLALLSAAARHL